MKLWSLLYCDHTYILVDNHILRIAAHSKDTWTLSIALVATFPTMFLVTLRIHALTFAAYLSIAAFLSTLPAVGTISGQVHTFFHAAIWSYATFNVTHIWVFVTCHHHPLRKESVFHFFCFFCCHRNRQSHY